MPTSVSFFEKRNFLLVVFGFQLFRLCLLPFIGLMPQDAYYFFYGQNLALSYFDHPGMIGYLLRLFTALFGRYAFVIKLADFTLTSFTLYFFWILAGYFLPKNRQRTALVLLCTTSLISVLTAIATPDVPLLFFWTLSLICLYEAIFNGKKIYWIWAGVAMGLGFDSKYTSILIQAGLILFVIFSAKYRRLLLSGWFWLSIFISILMTFPVFYWNHQHGYASFLFQSSGRSQSMSLAIKPTLFFGTIGHQAFILLPCLFIVMVQLVYRYRKTWIMQNRLPSPKVLFLLCFFVPAFLGFFCVSLFYWVKINWMMPAYLSGTILAAMLMRRKWAQVNVVLSIIIHLALAIEIIYYVVPIKSDDTWFGWRQLAAEVQLRKNRFPGAFVFSDDNYKTTAELSFYMPDKVYAQNVIGKKALQYDYVNQDLHMLAGKDALFIDSDTQLKNTHKKGNYPEELNHYFSKVTELNPILIRHNNRVVRKFWVYYCQEYRRVK